MIFLAESRLVTLSDEVTREIARFTRHPESGREAGGLLLGSYRGPHVEILKCTTPMLADVRTRFGFVRQDAGHQRAATAEWSQSGGAINFVGEWHTHPEGHPNPSFIDRSSWKKQMRTREPEPLVFLIGGTFRPTAGLDITSGLRQWRELAETRRDGDRLRRWGTGNRRETPLREGLSATTRNALRSAGS